MTKDLTPRKLDALVAKKVMGWRRAEPLDGEPRGWPPDCKEKMWRHGISIPHYSTQIERSWTVVEAVRAMGFVFILESHGDPGAPGRWWAYFSKDSGRNINGYGSEAPKAICLAALAAVESKERHG